MMRHFIVLITTLSLAACSHGSRGPQVEPDSHPTPVENGAQKPEPGQPTPQVEAKPDPSAITPPSPPAKVKIMVRTSPSKVFVSWGRKKLGRTPLNFERPRDSGPVDLVLRYQGYFPVHTRAYTVKNDLVAVKMVRLENRMSVFGAKQEIPPDDGTAPSDAALDPNTIGKLPPPPPIAPIGAPPPPPTP